MARVQYLICTTSSDANLNNKTGKDFSPYLPGKPIIKIIFNSKAVHAILAGNA